MTIKYKYDAASNTIEFDTNDSMDKPLKPIMFSDEAPEGLQEDAKKVKDRTISKLVNSPNIAELLTEEELKRISDKVQLDFEEDRKSMKEWLENADAALDLTKIEFKTKNQPFDHAANIKYPLVKTASIQWCSRAMAEMVKNGNVANYKVIGKDSGLFTDDGQPVVSPGYKQRKGQRLAKYLNWQVMEKMPNWMDSRDKLFSQLTIVGTSFVKVWFDPIEQMNRCQLCSYDRVFVNNSIPSLDKAPRISEIKDMSTKELISFIRHDLFLDIDVYNLQMDASDTEAVYHELLEQHTELDLDNDGFPEPYIVIRHQTTGQILNITARYIETDVVKNSRGQIKKIYPENYYIDYHLLPSFDNSFFGIGFGTLLLNHNNTINTGLNQLMDAGHLSCTQGGFISKGIRIKGGEYKFNPGEYKPVTSVDGSALESNIYTFNFKEPSMVLFQLVQYLIESGEKLCATTDVMTGTQDATNVSPNTILQLLGESQKVYDAIFRRIFRGEKKELSRIMYLNSLHLNEQEYITVVDPDPEEIQEMYLGNKLSDFNLSDVDIVPVVDINESTQQQSLMKGQVVQGLAQQFAQLGAIDPKEAIRYVLTQAEVEDISKLIPPTPPPGQDPNALKVQLDQANFDSQLKLKVAELEMNKKESESKIRLQDAQAVKTQIEAGVERDKAQTDVYKIALEHSQADKENMIELHRINTDAQTKTDSTMSNHMLTERDHQIKKEIASIKKPTGGDK